ncbi:MAG: hypothetical protein IJX94_03195 [Clostridia bacterium]|nr:hypothetical protein [Clostridia bacterium]
MFDKTNMRPAMAGAAPSYSGTASRRRNDSLSYQTGAGEAEDLNAFNTFSEKEEIRRPQRKRPAPKKTFDKKALLIGAIAAAALVVLLALIIGVSVAGSGNITYKENAYVAYADGDGNYHVVVNGSTLDDTFEGEVEIVSSTDRSFAYVFDTGMEGTDIYLLKGKKLEAITTSPVSEVLAYAGLKPGVVFKENEKYYLYSEKTGEERITSDITTENLMISGDASTVTYTVAAENSAGETYLCIYQEGSSSKITKNCTPVAVSNYGDYVYGVAKDTNGKDNLYVITTKDGEKYAVENSTGFMGITAMNVDGDELLFFSGNGTDWNTFVYSFKKERTTSLAKYLLTPSTVDPTIAVYDSFKGVYLEGYNLDGTKALTGYLDNKYNWNNIVRAIGQFEAEGEFFYYINSEQQLMQLDLTNDNYPKVKVDDDVIDFTITEKGNVYSLNDDKQLRFYKVATGKKTRISDDATTISIYNYANEVYFSEEESIDVNVYTSKEGGGKDVAKMDSTPITDVPMFSDPSSKKCYAYYYDVDNGWILFYTSNGKSFDLISNDCQAINGIDISEDDNGIG